MKKKAPKVVKKYAYGGGVQEIQDAQLSDASTVDPLKKGKKFKDTTLLEHGEDFLRYNAMLAAGPFASNAKFADESKFNSATAKASSGFSTTILSCIISEESPPASFGISFTASTRLALK